MARSFQQARKRKGAKAAQNNASEQQPEKETEVVEENKAVENQEAAKPAEEEVSKKKPAVAKGKPNRKKQAQKEASVEEEIASKQQPEKEVEDEKAVENQEAAKPAEEEVSKKKGKPSRKKQAQKEVEEEIEQQPEKEVEDEKVEAAKLAEEEEEVSKKKPAVGKGKPSRKKQAQKEASVEEKMDSGNSSEKEESVEKEKPIKRGGRKPKNQPQQNGDTPEDDANNENESEQQLPTTTTTTTKRAGRNINAKYVDDSLDDSMVAVSAPAKNMDLDYEPEKKKPVSKVGAGKKKQQLKRKDSEVDSEEAVKKGLFMSLLKPISNAEFFSRDYFNRGMKECPKLASVSGESLNDYVTAVVAYNLAYNAFYRGERVISLKLLNSVMASTNLPETLYLAASLLEILIYIEMNNLFMAKNLIKKICANSSWKKSANEKQKECLDVLIARTNLTKFVFPTNRDMQSFHWFLLNVEKLARTGRPDIALDLLFVRKRNANNDQKRFLNNSIGCAYLLLKQFLMAEEYFQMAILKDNNSSAYEFEAILSPALNYHLAIAQLSSKKSEQAFISFLKALPFYYNNPRIWLRIAECCATASNNNKKFHFEEENLEHKLALEYWNKLHEFIKFDVSLPEQPTFDAKFVLFAANYGLKLAKNEFAHLRSYLYNLLALSNLKLGFYNEASEAAQAIPNLEKVTNRQIFSANFIYVESQLLLKEFAKLRNEAKNVVSKLELEDNYIKYRMTYNLILVDTIEKNYEKANHSLQQLIMFGSKYSIYRPETISMYLYLNMQRRRDMARFVFGSGKNIKSPSKTSQN